ncbi:NAD(P)/FAD-dependent oxidoreductase [Pseudomonadota bacterium]
MIANEIECNVLIVGGGPAGLSVASHLADNISSIIVHQDIKIGEPVRTSGGTFVSNMIDLGIPEELYQVIDRLDFYSDNEQASFAVEADKLAVLDVTKLYRYLAELSDNKKRRLMLGAKFEAAKQLPDGRYRSTVRSRKEGKFTVISEYVIDASGWHCAALESLGLGKKPDRLGVGIEYEFPIGNFDPHRMILFVGSTVLSGYGWVFPTPDHRIRLGVGITSPDSKLNPRQVMDNFIKEGHAERFGIVIPDDYKVNAGIIPSVIYEEKLVFGNAIRIGDSANFATPAVGEGIRIAIKFGRLLGLELSNKINGDEKALNRYQEACTKEFKRNYNLGFLINKRITQYSIKQWDQSVRRLSRLTALEMTQMLRHQFDWKVVIRVIRFTLLAKIRGWLHL